MNQRERDQIQKAIDHLMTDDEFEIGMDILKKLAEPGWKNPLEGLKTVNYLDVCSREENV
jgi:hypothetical protein